MICLIKLFTFILHLTILCNCLNNTIKTDKNKVLLIALGGFRWDYLNKTKAHGKNISAFETIINEGLQAKHVQGVFNTFDCPSLHSIATGQYEETHQIVHDIVFIPKKNESFICNHNNTIKNKFFDAGGEPIWITNELNGKKSAVINWYGCDVTIKNKLPTYYSMNVLIEKTLDKPLENLLEWLKLENVTLGMIYYDKLNTIGINHGPDSPEVMDEIEKINNRLDWLLKSINSTSELKQKVNLILTSNHGMASISKERIINLTDYLNDNKFGAVPYGVTSFLMLNSTNKTMLDQMYNKLHGKHPQLNVFKKENIPDKYHYKHSDRISPLIVFANLNWLIAPSKTHVQNYSKLNNYL